jgi:hypothetical protein
VGRSRLPGDKAEIAGAVLSLVNDARHMIQKAELYLHVVPFVLALRTMAYVAVFGRVASMGIDPPRPIFHSGHRSPSPCSLGQDLSTSSVLDASRIARSGTGVGPVNDRAGVHRLIFSNDGAHPPAHWPWSDCANGWHTALTAFKRTGDRSPAMARRLDTAATTGAYGLLLTPRECAARLQPR